MLPIAFHFLRLNVPHWHLDTNFYEDANSTMNKKPLYNLSVINKIVPTLLKLLARLFRNGFARRTQRSLRSHYEEHVVKIFVCLQGKDLKKVFKK